jgi:hypothetical protein
MCSISQLKQALPSTKSIARETARWKYLSRLRSFNVDGIDIFDEDWDNLIILDACRYDTFAEFAAPQLPGIIDSRISRGSTTSEFIRGNFSEKCAHDTVYASANSWYARLRDEIDAEVFKFIELNGVDYRDPETLTFHPKPVTEGAKTIYDDYPNKKLIVHYVQPHSPFMGPTAQRYFTQYGLDTPPELAKKADITTDLIRKAYRETLEEVLPYVSELVEYMDGKIVVTADHGELLGERYWPIPYRGFGHHKGIHSTELVKVPWLEIPSDERKKIVAETPRKNEIEDDEVNKRLQDLGYKV